MKAGIVINVGDPLAQVELAARAEAAGWDGVFTWDAIAIGDMDTYDPWALLAAMSLVTSRVTLGAMVFAPTRRRPWKMAREAATTIEHGNARMPRSLAPAPQRRQIDGVLHEHQLRVPLAFVLGRVVDARQPAQVGVERCNLIVFAHGLQAGVEQHVAQLKSARVKFGQVAPAQIEGQRAAIELVCTSDQSTCLLHVMTSLL